MKKAVAKTTVKIDRVTYLKGSVFTEPFPEGVQKEIDVKTGTVEMLPPEKVEPKDEKTQTEKEKKIELRDYAKSEFGVDIHHASSLKKIEQTIDDLEAMREVEKDNSEDLNEGLDSDSDLE